VKTPFAENRMRNCSYTKGKGKEGENWGEVNISGKRITLETGQK
jgi:hypothetical protein